ncbi:MAG: diguanylate cyclase, partial [Pirellulales bacterium]|nr:diguanylate cyclase [Pirellulales bacterium]
VGLIVGGCWLGLLPDVSQFAEQARQQRCEEISLTAAALIRENQWTQLEPVLAVQVDQDEELIAIEVRGEQGRLRIGEQRVFTAAPDGEASTHSPKTAWDLPRNVTLKIGQATFGEADFYYANSTPIGWSASTRHPLLRLIAFFVTVGLCVYTLFVVRMMGTFEVTRIVPDRIRDALDTLSEGLLIMDEQQRIILANHAFSETVGLSQENLIGRSADSLSWVCSDATTSLDLPWMQAIDEAKPQTEQLMRYRLPGGEYRLFSINASPITAAQSAQPGALVTFRDVTDGEAHRAELEHMLVLLRISRDEISSKNRELEILATQDALTGCFNRRALFEQYESHWRRDLRGGGRLSCLMIDNDHFKQVNDTYGHHVGDEVLKEVAAAINSACPEPALVCRYGGEEFCVMLPETTLDQAQQQAETVRGVIEQIRLPEPAELRLTASIGVSGMEFAASDAQDLIDQADRCLYVAKRNGRNQVVVYSADIERLAIEQEDIREESETARQAASLSFPAVTALVSALAYRDSDTARHSRRVADLCVRTATGMMDQESIYVLEIAALLHDIGKIGIPDNLLLKPGKLTSEEWKLMRRHDRIGAEIVSGTFNCSQLDEIIQNHHAFYGGRATEPHLPVGQEIPLAARLLTIADSYDSIVSDHVYRRGRSHREAIEELRRCAGTQFDPTLVEHFASTIGELTPSAPGLPTTLPRHMATQIGVQVERLADALDARDAEGMQTLASWLGAMARHHRLDSIALAAEKIELGAAQENMQWISLLRHTQQLLNLCRAAQDSVPIETKVST